jgi:hypothetical protein
MTLQLRIGGLAELDPLEVPLPHGTEVTTRVDRSSGERVIKQGAVGRVVGSTDSGELDVEIVGVGTLRYLRNEVVPRKAGQLRFAQRRAAAWSALGGCVVLETVVGSRAWGLADEGSDTDVRGVFALPFSWTTGLVAAPEDLVSIDGSTIYWEVEKVFKQALKADPNTLETLFVKSAKPLDPIGEWILEARDAFASAEIYGSFGRYALSQVKRLRQSLRLARHRSYLLQWLDSDSPPSLDEVAARLADETGLRTSNPDDATLRAKQYIKQVYGSLYDQGLLAQRDYASLIELARKASHEMELPRELRPKNAYNLLRLIATATAWLRTGSPDFEIKEPLRAELLSIKNGQVALDDVLDRAELLTADLEAARASSPLPRRGDVRRADLALRKIRQELARRHLEAVPGPFGKDAPELPAAEWSE